tara:strand:+ start:1213 stop:1557 length:345 start_codon:yes stop_codon:yes gene_type:complete
MIASAVEASLSLIRSHGYSIHFHKNSEIKPLLKVQSKIIADRLKERDLFLIFIKRITKLTPRGRTKSGKSLLSVYVLRTHNFFYSIKKLVFLEVRRFSKKKYCLSLICLYNKFR